SQFYERGVFYKVFGYAAVGVAIVACPIITNLSRPRINPPFRVQTLSQPYFLRVGLSVSVDSFKNAIIITVQGQFRNTKGRKEITVLTINIQSLLNINQK